MPSQLPRAAFEPISPNLELAALVESTPNFEYAVRIPCEAIDQQGVDNFEKLVLLHVVRRGKPLVIEGYQRRLEKYIFSQQWLKDNHGSKTENARNLTTQSYLPLSIRHYLKCMSLLTDQWKDQNYKDTNRQRIYLKDIDCPPVWEKKVKDILPKFLFYLNESTTDTDNGVARAGDLMSSLPPAMRAENLQCYIGHEGTYTPSHREMCGTLGHNIMVEASTGALEDGKPTKPGSSIWFMTETKDRRVVSEYWLSTLGHDIEIEDHFAQINAWKAASFRTYVVEQKPGDFILIPPMAPHQVWNRGTRTMKVAWNRTTVETLQLALNEALPKARMVCRDEQYKVKAIIYFTLEKYSLLLSKARSNCEPRVRQMQKDFRQLFSLYTQILLSETFSRDLAEPRNIEYLPFTSNVICSYCRGNIFNRFLTCPSCVGKLPDGDDDTYDICMECYAIGRSCACISKLKWVEQFRWNDLTKKHEVWRKQLIEIDASADDTSYPFQPLLVERERLGKRTLAGICQCELARRPWIDITKPVVRNDNDAVVEVDDDGTVRKRRKIRRSEKWLKEHSPCHICKAREPNWKLASCTQCAVKYCYGSLFRAFDISPHAVLEQLSWICPKCQKICSCGACRRDPTMNPFEPRGTLLGHDTRKVADPRSIESLADFSVSNISWIKKAGDHTQGNDSRRMKRRLEEAERAKIDGPAMDYQDVDSARRPTVDANGENNLPLDPVMSGENSSNEADNSELPVDPALAAMPLPFKRPGFVVPDNAIFREDMVDRYQPTEAITFEYPDPIANPVNVTSVQYTSNSTGNTVHMPATTLVSFQIGSGQHMHDHTETNGPTIIQSDVLQADPAPKAGPGVNEGQQTIDSDDVKVSTRRRRRNRRKLAGLNGLTKRNSTIIAEENDELSDDGYRDTLRPSRAKKISKTQRFSRRISAKAGNDEPLFVEDDDDNPPDEGSLRNDAENVVETTPTSAALDGEATTMETEPNTVQKLNGDGEMFDNTETLVHTPPRRRKYLRKSPADQNLKAKLRAMLWAQGEVDVSLDWLNSDEEADSVQQSV